jgi:hypothetical protein
MDNFEMKKKIHSVPASSGKISVIKRKVSMTYHDTCVVGCILSMHLHVACCFFFYFDYKFPIYWVTGSRFREMLFVGIELMCGKIIVSRLLLFVDGHRHWLY